MENKIQMSLKQIVKISGINVECFFDYKLVYVMINSASLLSHN